MYCIWSLNLFLQTNALILVADLASKNSLSLQYYRTVQCSLSTGFLKLFCSETPLSCENFFFATLFMDSLDVNDTCKCPIGPHKSQEAFLSVGKSYK